MPIIRNPFRRNDEATRATESEKSKDIIAPPRHIDIKEPTEYKLSEINDSGVYLPPSPTERKNFWSTKSTTSSNSSSSNHRQMLAEEPFNISRESFDSYRRSFDISARAPVYGGEGRPRVSLDSRLHSNPPRHSTSFNRPLPPAEEDTFEDVGLDEPKPKKQSFLSRFTHSGDNGEPRPSSGHGFHISGRKRGQSGGQELSSMPKPDESAEKPIKGGED